jgi:3D (Asp-Asp-Asp) domain-containing protein
VHDQVKRLAITFGFVVVLTSRVFASEQSVLARVTVYWNSGESGQHACWNGVRLRPGHCAVDPKKISYGSKVIFPDATCVAVDTGPDVVNRKAARRCGHTATERNAIVIDRFFESRQAAQSWTKTHPHFMTVRVVTTEKHSKPDSALASANIHPTVVASANVQSTASASTDVPPLPVAGQDDATVGAQRDLRTTFIAPHVSTALTWPRSARRRT